MNSNHLAINLVTKGLLNISNITKGMVFSLVLKPYRKRHGGAAKEYPPHETIPIYYEKDDLFDEIKKREPEEIDYIKVYVDWNKVDKGSKRIKAKLIKKYIQAEILSQTGKKIEVKLDNKKPEN